MFSSYSWFSDLHRCSVMKLLLRNYRKKVGNRNNIGIQNRLSIFSEENPDLDNLQIDDKALDELEIELTSGTKVVNLHERNLQSMKKETDLKIIERKYFVKTKYPNFLTWAEKEQIRNLHRNDPSFWTYNKLSQSFPAPPDIIKKVIQSSWRPETKERILRHDESVSNNWKKFKKGDIQLDPVFKQHLIAFSSREHIQHQTDYDHIKLKEPSIIKGSEFARIITDYKKHRPNGEEDTPVPPENYIKKLPDTFDRPKNYEFSQLEKFKNSLKSTKSLENKMTTLEELRKNTRLQKGSSEFSHFDEAFLKGVERGTGTLTEIDVCETIPVKLSKKENEIRSMTKIVEDTPAEEPTPMTIKIPADAPKGSVYKVKDVYYDTDGRYLYRVPGMK